MKTAKVKKINDGDTFEITDDVIRLENVDAPEINTEDGSYEKKITSMIDNGANTVTLEADTSF